MTGYHPCILLASKTIWAPGGGGAPGVNSRRCGPLGARLGAATTHGELGTLDPNGGDCVGSAEVQKGWNDGPGQPGCRAGRAVPLWKLTVSLSGEQARAEGTEPGRAAGPYVLELCSFLSSRGSQSSEKWTLAR